MSIPSYTQEEILEAWKTFIARGIIPEDKVRPIVARSWERCRSHGLDPWSSDFPKCSTPLLKKKKAEHAEVLAVAGPLMRYLFILLNCNISICDAEGFIYELITPLKHYPRTLGTYVKEATCGNGAVTIALQEKVPVKTEGYEHYRVISQICGNASAPIIMDGRFMGVLNAVNPFGPLPNEAFPMIIAAAGMIERLLADKKGGTQLLRDVTFYQELLDRSTKSVVILDNQGTVLAVNQAFHRLLGYSAMDLLIGRSISDYLAGKKELSVLLNNESWQKDQMEYHFIGKEERKAACRLVRRAPIGLPYSEGQTLLIFDQNMIKDETGACGSIAPSVTLKQPQTQDVDYIGESPAWIKVSNMIQKTAPFPSNVLLQGETGTGKEVVARAIHRLSGRKGRFVALNCGSIPKELLQSELFGYEQGAFTGARAQGSIGKFEHAHEGTLLLDEISEMPLDMQISLLRFIQERVVTRISSNKPKKVDVRIIAASNKNMAELVRKGQFREDLYYRLNVIEINLPPLRDRKSDIPLFADHFVSELSKQFNIPPRPVSKEVIDILNQYDWPGNVRELKNVMEKSLVLSEGKEITPEVLPHYILHRARSSPASEGAAAEDLLERERIVQILESYSGNISKAAKKLNMARNTLYRKIEKYNIRLKTSAVEGDKKG